MNYKRQVFIIFLVLIRFYAYSQNQPGHMEVKYVNFRIETIMAINPAGFDSDFPNHEYLFWDLDQHDSGSGLAYSYLTQFKRIKKQNVDVRLEIIYSVNNVERKRWMNKFGIFTDGKFFYTNENLYRFLLKTLNQL